jgi:hypothetical protein
MLQDLSLYTLFLALKDLNVYLFDIIVNKFLNPSLL